MPRDLLNCFVGSIEMLILRCISAKENYYNLRKIALNFRRVSLKGVLLSVGVLERFGESF